jgi:hypothetical protein
MPLVGRLLEKANELVFSIKWQELKQHVAREMWVGSPTMH